MIFENVMQRRYLGSNRENLAGEWIGVYEEDIQDLLAVHVARMGKGKTAQRV